MLTTTGDIFVSRSLTSFLRTTALVLRLTLENKVWFGGGGIGYFLLCTGSESPELLVISSFYINETEI